MKAGPGTGILDGSDHALIPTFNIQTPISRTDGNNPRRPDYTRGPR